MPVVLPSQQISWSNKICLMGLLQNQSLVFSQPEVIHLESTAQQSAGTIIFPMQKSPDSVQLLQLQKTNRKMRFCLHCFIQQCICTLRPALENYESINNDFVPLWTLNVGIIFYLIQWLVHVEWSYASFVCTLYLWK